MGVEILLTRFFNESKDWSGQQELELLKIPEPFAPEIKGLSDVLWINFLWFVGFVLIFSKLVFSKNLNIFKE